MKKYILFCFFAILSCKENGIPSEDELPQIKRNIIEKGDDYSHTLLDVYYDENNLRQEMLPYTFVMVNKFKKKELYTNLFHDYLFLNDTNGKLSSFNKFDTIHKTYLYNLLIEGSRNNDIGCLSYLDSINRFGYFGRKDLKKADSIKSIINSELKMK